MPQQPGTTASRRAWFLRGLRNRCVESRSMSVLVAANDSPHGLSALRTGIAEATRRNRPLAILMLDPVTELPASFKAVLATAPTIAEAATVRYRREVDEPADIILDVADDIDASLIVIGTHKRSGQGVYLMGATTQRVLLDASAPVLVVKATYASG